MEDYETQLNQQAKEINTLQKEKQELMDRLNRQLRSNLTLIEISEGKEKENTKLKERVKELESGNDRLSNYEQDLKNAQ